MTASHPSLGIWPCSKNRSGRQVAGERPYTNALRREGSDLKTNRVSPEQTAQLWNEQGRPAPGGGLWSPTKVIKLLAAD